MPPERGAFSSPFSLNFFNHRVTLPLGRLGAGDGLRAGREYREKPGLGFI